MRKTLKELSMGRKVRLTNWLCALPLAFGTLVQAQETASNETEGDVFELSPFEINETQESGYMATTTLAGTRIRTDLSDVGSAISVYTAEFLQDIGAYDNETLMAYTVNADVGGPQGTFVNATEDGVENENFGAGFANVRIRGLTTADNTRDYFKVDTPNDGYNSSRTEVIRGANSILFGLGSPAGIVNSSSSRAQQRNFGQLQMRFDEFSSLRTSLDYNRVLIEDELAVRVALLRNDQKYQQKPAFKLDKRIWGTLAWEPKFARTKSSRLKLEIAAEQGKVESNSRRGSPPRDLLTFWLRPIEEGGFGGQTVDNRRTADDNWTNIGFDPDGESNPLVSTAWGNGTVVLVYDQTAQPVDIFEKEANSVWGWRQRNPWHWNVPNIRNSSQNSIPQAYNLPVFFNGYREFARLNEWEFADKYQNKVITDTNIYPIYTQLIDGDSKREMREWYNARADLVHSFFNNKISYNLQFFRQEMEFDRYAALGGSSDIRIDAAQFLPDGRPNPNAGRALLRESPFTGSRAQTSDRKAWRATLYLEHDFSEKNDNMLARILGKHFLTGTMSNQTVEQTRFDYMSNGVGPDWWGGYDENGDPIPGRLVISNLNAYDQFQTRSRTLNYFYISDSLVGKTLGQDLGLSNVGPATPPITGLYNYRYFDADARKTAMHPDPALRTLEPSAPDPEFGFAGLNPNNYVGWTEGQLTLYGAQTDTASRDYLTRIREFQKDETDSRAFVWQGKFLDGAVIGTYGRRTDDYSNWKYTWDEGRERPTDFDPSQAAFEFAPVEKDGPTTNWSVVLHSHRLLKKLPFELSLLYSEGENVNPDPARTSVFRGPVLSAAGSTVDKSLVLATRDNKWILRVTQYETSVKNASSTSTLQSQKFRLEQFFRFQMDDVHTILVDKNVGWGSINPTLIAKEADGTIDADEQEDLDAQRINVPNNIAAAEAWIDFESEFAARFPVAVEAWLTEGSSFAPSTNSSGNNWSYPENAVLLEDTISKGYEVEIVANPTKNWRISANISKTEAIRDNLPGAEFGAIMDFINESLFPVGATGPTAGDVPGGVRTSTGEPTFFNSINTWAPFYDAYRIALQNNGKSVNELSKWRYNIITNYTFRDGPLKGFSVGGSYRYEGPKTIGYGYTYDANNVAIVDLDTQFKSEAISTFGFWLRYSRKLTDSIDWTIQANIYNAFESDRVVPTSTQPDGSMARGMIREGRSWAITNTFKF